MKESAECLNLRKKEEQMAKQQNYPFYFIHIRWSPLDSAKYHGNGEKGKGNVPKTKTTQNLSSPCYPHGQAKNIKRRHDEKDQNRRMRNSKRKGERDQSNKTQKRQYSKGTQISARERTLGPERSD
jgi:hypothetical protein